MSSLRSLKWLGLWLLHLRGTLKVRVVLVAVVSALLASTVSVYSLSRDVRGETLRTSAEQQAEELGMLAALVNSKVEQLQALVRLLAQDITPQDLTHPQAIQERLAQRRITLNLFEWIALAGTGGAEVLHQVHGRAADPAMRALADRLAARAVHRGQPQLSEPLLLAGRDSLSVLLALPLRDSAMPEAFGALLVALPLHSNVLLPAVIKQEVFQSTPLIVYTDEGTVLAHPDPRRIGGRVLDEPGLAAYHEGWLTQGTPLSAEGKTVTRGGYLVSVAGLPAAQWFMARVTPVPVALGPLASLQRQAWWVTAGVAGLCASLAALAILWLTQPISRLHDRTQRLLDPALPAAEGWPRATGEIGDLVAAFRRVAMAQEREQQALRQLVGQMEAVMQHASVGIVVSRNRKLELLGHHAYAMLGYEPGELQGRESRVLYPSDEAYAEMGQRAREQFATQGHFDGELVFRRRDGSDFWIRMQGRGVVPDEPDGGTIWIFEDITAEREARERLSWSATHDGLTGLINRREFEQRLQAVVEPPPGAVAAPEAVPGCLLFIDLDRFKAVNDTAGHAAGDQVLQQLARVMEALVRQTDTVARLGGDEFALLLPGCSLERAQDIAERLRGWVEAWRIVLGGFEFQIGTSIGVVQITPGLGPTASVLHAADSACYRAKRAGRNRVMVYDGEPVSAL